MSELIFAPGSYMVVDCGGGTVDITVHSVSSTTGTLRELHKATGGPCGSIGEQLRPLLSKRFRLFWRHNSISPHFRGRRRIRTLDVHRFRAGLHAKVPYGKSSRLQRIVAYVREPQTLRNHVPHDVYQHFPSICVHRLLQTSFSLRSKFLMKKTSVPT